MKGCWAVAKTNNHDEKRFLWSILASKHPARDNPSHVTIYIPYKNTVTRRGIRHPVKIQQINKFEQKKDISVNVFSYEEKKIFPIQVTENKGRRHHINLLLINNENTHHYILSKDLSRFPSWQYKGYNRHLFFFSLLPAWLLFSCNSRTTWRKM